MAAKKNPVARPGRPAPAPKPKAVANTASIPMAPKAPVPPRAPQPEPVRAKDGKEKKSKKKDKKMNESDNEAGKKSLVRDSFTMPAADYALIGVLKARTLASGTSVKKSELLRAGLVALAAMPSAQLIDLIAKMPEVKTGRPGKKKK